MTLDIEIAELKREMAMRNKHYPFFIAKNKITVTQADAAKRDLQSAIETLEGLKFINVWFLKNHPDLLAELGLTGSIMCVLENYRINQGKIKCKEEIVNNEI